MGAIADSLRSTLRQLAEADARLYRGLAAELVDATPPRSLPATDAELAAAADLLRAHGYQVIPPKA